jgi:hypothetical protein
VTSDEELTSLLGSKKYDVFFIAPGMCSLIKNHVVKTDYVALVKKYNPEIIFVNVENVSEALPKLSAALGQKVVPGITALSNDWPFPN